MRGPGRRARARINISTLGNNEIVAALSEGSHYEIDFVQLMPSGGANTVGLLTGSTTIYSYPLDDNQGQSFDNTTGDYPIVCGTDEAININLSAATQVDGFILYRVVGGKDGM